MTMRFDVSGLYVDSKEVAPGICSRVPVVNEPPKRLVTVDAVSADQALEIAKRNYNQLYLFWRALRDSSNNQYEYCIQGYTVRFGKR